MKYQIPMVSNKEIEEMDDNQLYQETKNLKRLIYKIRKNGHDSKEAEEEISYLQAEMQNRNYN